MNYKLCKQLKDAGYSFKPYDGRAKLINWDLGEGHVACPTLEELIDACDSFYSLTYDDNKWEAIAFMRSELFEATLGKTPLEAVAKLWLKLNKPDKTG